MHEEWLRLTVRVARDSMFIQDNRVFSKVALLDVLGLLSQARFISQYKHEACDNFLNHAYEYREACTNA